MRKEALKSEENWWKETNLKVKWTRNQILKSWTPHVKIETPAPWKTERKGWRTS